MKKIVISSLLAVFGLAAAPLYALRIAYVDVTKVVDQYEGTKDAKEKLAKQRDAAKSKINVEQTRLKSKVEDLKVKQKALTPDKYKEQEAAFYKEYNELEAKVQAAQEELVREEKKQMSLILDEVREAVNKIADKEKWDFVLTSDAIIFGGTEITASVIKALNKK